VWYVTLGLGDVAAFESRQPEPQPNKNTKDEANQQKPSPEAGNVGYCVFIFR
jgi:hypothetical protein